MIFIISCALMFFFVYFLLNILAIRGFLNRTILGFVSGIASILFIYNIANLLGKINSPIFILIMQGILLCIVLIVWWRAGKPMLREKRADTVLNRDAWNGTSIFIKGFTIFIILVSIFLVVLIVQVPINNNDVLMIHLPRVVQWLKHGNFFPWETNRTFQVGFPPNAELLFAWMITFTGSDTFVELFSLISGLIIALTIFAFSTKLGAQKNLAWLAALLWITLPNVFLQMSSARHDLMSASLYLIAMYLLYCFIKDNTHKTTLIFSGIALGIVAGMNLATLAFFPGFAVIVFLLYWKKKITPQEIIIFAAVFISAFIVFSIQIYISNILEFGSPIPAGGESLTFIDVRDEMPIAKYYLVYWVRWLYQMIDPAGLPQPLWGYALKLKALIASTLADWIHFYIEGDVVTVAQHTFYWDTFYPLQEDTAWFGPIGILVLLVTPFRMAVASFRKRNLWFAVPIIIGIGFFLVMPLIRPGWNPYDGRYFLPLVAMSLCFLPWWFKNRTPHWLPQVLLITVGIIVVLSACVYNPAKPIFGDSNIWNMHPIDMQIAQMQYLKDMHYMVDAYVPANGVIGLASGARHIPEYHLYGKEYGREIVPVSSEHIGDSQWLQERNVEYLLILVDEQDPGVAAEEFVYYQSMGNWILLEKPNN